MKFRRIPDLPPYVFTIINGLKIKQRQAGIDVVDLGFGNPDLPSPDVAVEELSEAARDPNNHRYSLSKGIPALREAAASFYKHRFNVELDPETEIINTIGSKEGLTHLMWVLLAPGDTCLVPTPSYPIHVHNPCFPGAKICGVPLAEGDEYIENLHKAWHDTEPKPRVVIISFPHNPTTICVDLDFMQKVVDFAQAHDIIIVHDNAYADIAFDGYSPPSILQIEGAKEHAVEFYTLTKSFSMAGWRVAFMLGNTEVVGALTKMKSYLDYGSFQPIQMAAAKTMASQPDYPSEASAIYEGRRNALCDGLNSIGWQVTPPQATMFVWAEIPEPYAHLGSVEFATQLVTEGCVATSPGVGFGESGEGHVRFALIEDEERIHQGVDNLRQMLDL